jgi:GWxTD domain-containing protein
MIKSVFLLLLSIPFFTLSQERVPGKESQERPSLATFEAVSIFGPDSSKAYVNIHYRIPRSFFVFVKPSDPTAPKDEFVARGQLQVELFNEQDVSVAREIRPFALTRTSLPQIEERQGDIVFEVDDLESGRSFLDKQRSVKAQLVSHKSLDLSSPFLAIIDSTQQRGIRYLAMNHGTNVLYGGVYGGVVCQVYCPQCDSALKIHWTLHGESENRAPQVKELNGTQFNLVGGLLNLTSKEGSVTYEPKPFGPAWKILYVPVTLELLEPGQYKLVLNATDGKEQFKHEMSFRLIWPNRPTSLMDWDIAIDALRFIAKPEEIDKILSSSSESETEAFRAFWRKHDPDTTNTYNEIMVEYYRRVDETIRQFSTIKEHDGYKTDRGRIYVLNGPPTHVERSVLPGQLPREIWTYDNIKKQFVFTEKNKSGNYILTQSNTL